MIILGIVGTLANGFFAAKVAETALEAATGNQVDINRDGQEITIKGDDSEGLKVTSTGKVPDGFPDSVPVYGDAKVLHAQTTTIGEDQYTYNFILETDDSVDKVGQYYDGAFSKENGWKSLSRSASGDYVQSNILNESKDIGVIMSISVDDESGKTNITIITRNQVVE